MTERHIRDFSLDFFSLSGKKAIVTGGNRGLGQAYAVAMAKAGADLYIPTVADDDGIAARSRLTIDAFRASSSRRTLDWSAPACSME